MAVTCLMHMKESPGTPHEHLRNAIDYILDVKHGEEKTRYGELVGGNSGLDHKEILQNFLQTKRDYEKMDGRQGYHFVLSFAPGETDEATAYQVVKEFCESYLGDTYDYVFAIHVDKKHLHGHIIFNSVSRMDGYKYHYKKGEWKKNIQPVTDRICKEHGLKELTFEEDKVGISYAEWLAEQKGVCNSYKILHADIDYNIEHSASWDEFVANMKRMGYSIRIGFSKKQQCNYIAYRFAREGMKDYVRREYDSKSSGYSLKEVAARIGTKQMSRSYEDVVSRLEDKAAGYLNSVMLRNTKTYKRLYQAVNYYKLPNPYAVPAYRVRRDMMRLDTLIADCRYLKEQGIVNARVLQKRFDNITERTTQLKERRRTLYTVANAAGEDVKECMEQYHILQRRMQEEML